MEKTPTAGHLRERLPVIQKLPETLDDIVAQNNPAAIGQQQLDKFLERFEFHLVDQGE
jgi:hypothetical protein